MPGELNVFTFSATRINHCDVLHFDCHVFTLMMKVFDLPGKSLPSHQPSIRKPSVSLISHLYPILFFLCFWQPGSLFSYGYARQCCHGNLHVDTFQDFLQHFGQNFGLGQLFWIFRCFNEVCQKVWEITSLLFFFLALCSRNPVMRFALNANTFCCKLICFPWVFF